MNSDGVWMLDIVNKVSGLAGWEESHAGKVYQDVTAPDFGLPAEAEALL